MIAEEYAAVLFGALEDLAYEDYRIAARSLPALVAGYISENNDICWRSDHSDQAPLDLKKLIETLNALNAQERIGILDCTVADRHRRESSTRTPANPNVAAKKTGNTRRPQRAKP